MTQRIRGIWIILGIQGGVYEVGYYANSDHRMNKCLLVFMRSNIRIGIGKIS